MRQDWKGFLIGTRFQRHLKDDFSTNDSDTIEDTRILHYFLMGSLSFVVHAIVHLLETRLILTQAGAF